MSLQVSSILHELDTSYEESSSLHWAPLSPGSNIPSNSCCPRIQMSNPYLTLISHLCKKLIYNLFKLFYLGLTFPLRTLWSFPWWSFFKIIFQHLCPQADLHSLQSWMQHVLLIASPECAFITLRISTLIFSCPNTCPSNSEASSAMSLWHPPPETFRFAWG